MVQVRLRSVRHQDLELLRSRNSDDDPYGFFGFVACNAAGSQFSMDQPSPLGH